MLNIFIFIIAITIGSFLNVCIHRIPKKESLVKPPSHCPACRHRLGLWDLIPIFSYIFLLAKCRTCGSRISIRYPLVELLTGTLVVLLFMKFGFTWIFIKYALLTLLLIVISFIDLDLQIIPDRLILFGLITGLIFNILYQFYGSLLNGILGLIIGGGIFLIIAIVTKGAMGGGDIKLMGVLGLWLGWRYILIITLFSFIIGALVSLFLLLFKIKGRKDYIPFGPFIAIAAMITMYYGQEILSWYMANYMGI